MMTFLKWGAASLVLGLLPLSAPAQAEAGKTLDAVKARGMLQVFDPGL